MKKISIIIVGICLFMAVQVMAEDIPPTFAQMNFSISSLNPTGFWKDAFSPAPVFSLSIQYPARVLNLYIGGKVDFAMLNGKEYRDVNLQLFSITVIISYNYLEYETMNFYAGTGLGINFEEIEFGDGSEDAVLGGVKLFTGFRKQISSVVFMNTELGYTYIADSPFITFGIGLSYSFGGFNK